MSGVVNVGVVNVAQSLILHSESFNVEVKT